MDNFSTRVFPIILESIMSEDANQSTARGSMIMKLRSLPLYTDLVSVNSGIDLWPRSNGGEGTLVAEPHD